MEHWQYLSVIAVLAIVTLTIRSAVIKKRKQKQREFDRKLETVLKPKETVKLVCPQKKGRCVLTSRRLLFETASGFTSVPLTEIRKVQGISAEGKNTVSVPKMKRLIVSAGKDYKIRNTSDQFPELAEKLIKKAAQNHQKKEKKTEKGKTPLSASYTPH